MLGSILASAASSSFCVAVTTITTTAMIDFFDGLKGDCQTQEAAQVTTENPEEEKTCKPWNPHLRSFLSFLVAWVAGFIVFMVLYGVKNVTGLQGF